MIQTLLSAPVTVIVHALPALAALGLGTLQLALPKDGGRHRIMGWLWVGLMAAVALSSFRIHSICLWRGWSPIHLLSILTLASLPMGIWHARRGRFADHAKAMKGLFFTALVLAGLFTLAPGRLMHAVLTGAPTPMEACTDGG